MTEKVQQRTLTVNQQVGGSIPFAGFWHTEESPANRGRGVSLGVGGVIHSGDQCFLMRSSGVVRYRRGEVAGAAFGDAVIAAY